MSDIDGGARTGGAGRRQSFATTRRERPAPPQPDDAGAAEAAALRILGGAAQSTAGLQRRLSRRGFDDDTSAGAVATMVEHGYVDDVALATSVAKRRTRNGFGKARIVADLRSRGVGSDDIASTLDAVDGDEEAAQALVVARGKWPLKAGEDRRHRNGRVGAVLQRRGFPFALITKVLRELESEPEE